MESSTRQCEFIRAWPQSFGSALHPSRHELGPSHGSRLSEHGTRISEHGSRVPEHGSCVPEHGSNVTKYEPDGPEHDPVVEYEPDVAQSCASTSNTVSGKFYIKLCFLQIHPIQRTPGYSM